jgi:MATE family, multidrug efflux pump
VRVGLAAGARNAARVRFAAFNAIGLGAGFMVICAGLVLVFPQQIIGLYLGARGADSPSVVAYASSFLLCVAAFQVFDSSQTIAAGALRGLKDTKVPAILAGISYWLIGMPLAVGLGLYSPLKGNGVWIGYVVALVVAAVLLVWRVAHMTGARRAETAHGSEPSGAPAAS